MDKKTTLEGVRGQYSEVALSQLSNDSSAVRSIALAFGYSEQELASLPTQANMGVSCGNPLALASVAEGEVVLDLGCGGGMDLFLAAQRVGPTGKAIGVDMTAEMLSRAQAGVERLGLKNVELHQATIDQLPLPDASVDCIISNCVINLVPDKAAVFREMLRVLKPGGRVALSDIALKQPLPEHVKHSFEAYVGCIGGAILIDQYRQLLQQEGFDAVTVTDTGADLNAYALATSDSSSSSSSEFGGGCCSSSSSSAQAVNMTSNDAQGSSEKASSEKASSAQVGCCGGDQRPASSALHDGLANAMGSFDANAFAASVRVHARKGQTH